MDTYALKAFLRNAIIIKAKETVVLKMLKFYPNLLYKMQNESETYYIFAS